MNNDDIVAVIEKSLKFKAHLIKVEPSPEVVKKKQFVFCIKILQDAYAASVLAEEEMGINLLHYEAPYHEVIATLFGMIFDARGVALIQFYLYELPETPEYDSKLQLFGKDGEIESTHKLKTPEDLWDILLVKEFLLKQIK